MRLIDADDFGNRMYHEAFEKDSDLQKWDSGCWIRYKLFENVLRGQPTVQTNLQPTCNQLATDTISRQAAIDIIEAGRLTKLIDAETAVNGLKGLPSAQPDIIRCRNCKFASGDSRICMKFGHSPIGELDFCAWSERRTDER